VTDVHQGTDDRHDVVTPEPAPAPRPAPTPGPRPGPTPGLRATADHPSSAAFDGDGASSVNELGDDRASDVAGRAAAVERLPLVERADGFAALHDDLRTRLESGGVARG
jgi:hypothetical protein